MKVTTHKGVVTVVSETKDEALALFQYVLEHEATTKKEVKPKQERKHKKHSHVKTCEVCGKGYRGNRALAQHKSQVHKIRSKNYEVYRRWRLNREAQKEPEMLVI